MKIIKTVKSGPVDVSVREYSDGRFGYDWRENGKRKQGRWRDKHDAIEAAKERANVLAAGRINLLEVNAEEFDEFRAWKESRAKSKTVIEVRDELLALKKEDADLDPVYVGNLSGPWELFCSKFGKRGLGEVQPSEIETWLRNLGKSPRTRNNIRDVIVQLFRFARQRDYLPDAITAAEKVGRLKIKARNDDIAIWTPAEMRLLLVHARPEFLPWLLFGAFAGIRTNEIRPRPNSRKDCLRWEDVQWGENQIFIRSEVAKTGRQRYIPLTQNLMAWLKPYRKKTGPVIVESVHAIFEDIDQMCARIAAAEKLTEFRFKKNALRHSFGSYRNAIIRNIGQLAEEMGNSPGIARKNYERPQPRAIADEWFGIMPTK